MQESPKPRIRLRIYCAQCKGTLSLEYANLEEAKRDFRRRTSCPGPARLLPAPRRHRKEEIRFGHASDRWTIFTQEEIDPPTGHPVSAEGRMAHDLILHDAAQAVHVIEDYPGETIWPFPLHIPTRVGWYDYRLVGSQTPVHTSIRNTVIRRLLLKKEVWRPVRAKRAPGSQPPPVRAPLSFSRSALGRSQEHSSTSASYASASEGGRGVSRECGQGSDYGPR